MNESDEILWSDQTKLRPNIWGLGYVGGHMKVSLFHTDYNRISPLATLLVCFIFIPVMGLILEGFLGRIIAILFVVACIVCLLYWFFIREIKYYQITKSMKYELTRSKCIFRYKYFGMQFSKYIPISNISQVHLVEFETNGIKTGSVYLYQKDRIKTFNLHRKERTYQAIVERVVNYRKFLELIEQLIRLN